MSSGIQRFINLKNKVKKIEIKQTEIRVEIKKEIKQKRGKDEKDRLEYVEEG